VDRSVIIIRTDDDVNGHVRIFIWETKLMAITHQKDDDYDDKLNVIVTVYSEQ